MAYRSQIELVGLVDHVLQTLQMLIRLHSGDHNFQFLQIFVKIASCLLQFHSFRILRVLCRFVQILFGQYRFFKIIMVNVCHSRRQLFRILREIRHSHLGQHLRNFHALLWAVVPEYKRIHAQIQLLCNLQNVLTLGIPVDALCRKMLWLQHHVRVMF